MSVTRIDAIGPVVLEPLSTETTVDNLPVGDTTFAEAQISRLERSCGQRPVTVAANFWPSRSLLDTASSYSRNVTVVDASGAPLLQVGSNSGAGEPEALPVDSDSVILCHPWQLLSVNAEVVNGYSESHIGGTVREHVVIDGNIFLGNGSVLLPGVYIEDNVYIGANCKIGPNCYIRGQSAIYDNCRVGQSVEIKHSILMPGVSVGHLSYLGDSVIGDHTNIGAGTITANFRHDGATHRTLVAGNLVDTGLRKFGTVMGPNVHTGIHTSIYPGRKLWPNCSTRPGDVVSKDITS